MRFRTFFEIPPGTPAPLARLFILYGSIALALAPIPLYLAPIAEKWDVLLFLGILAWGVASQGLRVLRDYALSLELSIYLFAYLCYGPWLAILCILLCSLLLIPQGMVEDGRNRNAVYVFRKLSNIFVLGAALYLAGLAMGLQAPTGFFDATPSHQFLSLLYFWLTFTAVNNLLFVPMDLARQGVAALRGLIREIVLDGALHGLSVLSGAAFALLFAARNFLPALLLLPVLILLVIVLKQLTDQSHDLAVQLTMVRKLNERSAEIHMSLDMPDVLEVVGRMSEELFQAETYFVALLDERNGKVQFACAKDHGEAITVEEADLDRGLTGNVIRSGKPVFISDLQNEEQWLRLTHPVGDETMRIRSIMMSPLLDNERCIGVYSVQSDTPRAFDPFHRELFLSTVQQISTAVVSARLYKRATQDALTRLYNKSYFEENLAYCLTEGEAFGLLFLDCDDFKAINDRFGHLVGDRYLQVLGTGIQSQCRSGDIPCRYGGDEFAILLRSATAAQTRAVAQRILDAVDQIGWQVNGQSVHTTASIGLLWASGDQDRLPVEDVLRVIDQCLYEAKVEKHTIRETTL